MIRKATPRDMDRIIQIWLDASRSAHDFIPFEYWRDHVSDMRSKYLPQSTTFVCEHENAVVGFISLVNTDLAAIFVTPEQQHHGYGRQLIQFAKAQSEHLTLCVYKNNSEAVRFYLAAGFTSTEERLDPDTNQVEIVMAWGQS